VLTRAIGLDSRLAIDHGMGELHQRDVFLLATDGVWGAVTEYELTRQLSEFALGRISADDAATALADGALAAGSSDNVSALLLKIESLPEENLRDALSGSQNMPLPPKLKPGQTLDGYLVEAAIHASQTTLLYRVIDPRSQRKLVLKTLHPDRANDHYERSAFAHEEWLAKRMVARFFPQVITPEQKNYLYYLTTWHEGNTLQQHLDAGAVFTTPDVIAHGTKLVRAIGALHRRSIIHRDIKPSNIHLGSDGELRVLDLGVAQSGLEPEDANPAPRAGTPSFLAPEQFGNAPPSRQTDVYAAGVTLYHLLTRRYPYGEIEPFQQPRFGEPVLPSRYRFETAEEFLLALERGATQPLHAPPAVPLAKRDPLSLWRTIAAVSLVLNLLLLYLLAVR
jgi:serine/threonine protein kinase